MGVLPYKRLMGMCRWMGSHFHDWIDYNGVACWLRWGSIVGHKIDYNEEGALRGQLHIPSKNLPKYLPPGTCAHLSVYVFNRDYSIYIRKSNIVSYVY